MVLKYNCQEMENDKAHEPKTKTYEEILIQTFEINTIYQINITRYLYYKYLQYYLIIEIL